TCDIWGRAAISGSAAAPQWNRETVRFDPKMQSAPDGALSGKGLEAGYMRLLFFRSSRTRREISAPLVHLPSRARVAVWAPERKSAEAPMPTPKKLSSSLLIRSALSSETQTRCLSGPSAAPQSCHGIASSIFLGMAEEVGFEPTRPFRA